MVNLVPEYRIDCSPAMTHSSTIAFSLNHTFNGSDE